jgi:hypothetical protein
MEITEAPYEELQQAVKTWGTLRGVTARFYRAKPTNNARVICETKAPSPSAPHLPAEPDIIAILTAMWRIPAAAARRSHNDEEPANLTIDPATMQQANDDFQTKTGRRSRQPAH